MAVTLQMCETGDTSHLTEVETEVLGGERLGPGVAV